MSTIACGSRRTDRHQLLDQPHGQDLAEKHGVPFFRSAVGEANVVDVMLAKEAVFGGEGNGGPIDPRVGLVRDSFVGMALILDAMAARDRTVAQLADELPRYEIVKTKIDVPRERIPAALVAVCEHFPDAQVDRLDGLRLDWPGSGCWCAPATPSRSCEPWPKRPRVPRRRVCAARLPRPLPPCDRGENSRICLTRR